MGGCVSGCAVLTPTTTEQTTGSFTVDRYVRVNVTAGREYIFTSCGTGSCKNGSTDVLCLYDEANSSVRIACSQDGSWYGSPLSCPANDGCTSDNNLSRIVWTASTTTTVRLCYGKGNSSCGTWRLNYVQSDVDGEAGYLGASSQNACGNDDQVPLTLSGGSSTTNWYISNYSSCPGVGYLSRCYTPNTYPAYSSNTTCNGSDPNKDAIIASNSASITFTPSNAYPWNTTYYIYPINQAQDGADYRATAKFTITQKPTLTPGSFTGSNESLCSPGDPTSMSVSAPSGGAGGTATYQWYYKDGNNSCPTGLYSAAAGWTAISGATSSSYDPPSGLTTTRTYACVTNNGCGSGKWTSGGCKVVTITTDNGSVSSGMSANDLLFTGASSIAFENSANWLKWSGSAWQTQSSTPSSTTNVFIKPNSNCISRQPTIDNLVTIMDNAGSANCMNITIANGATLTMSNNNSHFHVTGNWVNNGTFSGGTGRVKFVKSGSQTITDASGSINFYEMNTGSASITILNSNITITNALRLNGIVTTGSYVLHLNNSASDASAFPNIGGHINGTFRRTIAANTNTYAFPVGNGTTLTTNRYLLEFINNNIAGVTQLDCYVNPITESGNQDDPSLDTTGKCTQWTTALSELLEGAQWDLTPVSGSVSSGSYGVNLYVSNISGLSSPADDNRFTVVKRNSNSTTYFDWDAFSSSTTIPGVGAFGRVYTCSTSTSNGSGTGNGYAQKTGFTNFSKFGIAKARIFTSPLPVKLSSLEVSCDKDIKKLSWETLKESNCNLYVIEGSTDGLNYEEIKQLDCENNPNGDSYYYETNDNKNYFKLKQIDFDGNYEYFGPVYANCNNNEINSIKIFPNPNNGEQINIQFYNTLDSDVTYSVYNALGQVIYNGNFKTGQQLYQINLEKKLSNGIYFIRLQYNSFSFIVNSKE
jgi:hypothetical protein